MGEPIIGGGQVGSFYFKAVAMVTLFPILGPLSLLDKRCFKLFSICQL